jgi:hypothetical protein
LAACRVSVSAPARVSRLSGSYWNVIGVPPFTLSEATRKLVSNHRAVRQRDARQVAERIVGIGRAARVGPRPPLAGGTCASVTARSG